MQIGTRQAAVRVVAGILATVPFGCSGSPPSPDFHIVVEFPDVESPYDVLPDDADGVGITYNVAVQSGWRPAGQAAPNNPHVDHINNTQCRLESDGGDPLTLRFATSDIPNGWQVMQPPGQYTVNLYANVIWVDSQGGHSQHVHLKSKKITIASNGTLRDELGDVLHDPAAQGGGGANGGGEAGI